MDAKEKVLATMKEAGQPLNAGKIAELSGLDRKEVDAAMKQLKALSLPPERTGYPVLENKQEEKKHWIAWFFLLLLS